jgi:GNAT superfamily N-acetyltransferase
LNAELKMAEIVYAREPALSTEEFIALLHASGLAERRPVADRPRIEKMLQNSNLIVTARRSGALVGVSRAITDFAYACYLSDLAVDRTCQGQGIGRRLIEETRRVAGQESMCLLLSAPDAIPFYRTIGMPQPDNAFLFKRER